MKIVYRKPLDELSVDPIQAREAIRRAGLLGAVETYINDAATDPLVKSAWEYALVFKRTSPTILAVAAAMGWTDDELDSLFVTASQIDY